MPISIYAKDLVKKYGSRTVVNNVSFEVHQGEIVGLLGPNGAGKTTSFYQVVGLVRPDEGKVFLNEQDITSLPMYKRAKMGIGYLPQEASIFRKLSVEDNLAAVLEMTNLSGQEQKAKRELLLDEFHLHHVRRSNGDVLSGGERRRTEIARALAVDPKFILLDEPFAGIDPIAVEDIQAIVAKLKYKNIGILITDHNVTETLSICDRAYLLIDGKIFKHGTAEELAADEQVRKLYLGRNFELKRKDYLHDEAKESFSISSNTLTNLLDSNRTIQFVQDSIDKTKVLINSINNISDYGGSGATMAVDLKTDEYFRQINEIKTILIQIGTAHQHQELVQKASEIPDLNYKEFEKIFQLADYSKLGGGFFARITSPVYLGKLKKLKNKLNQVDSALSTSGLYIKAIN
jgi:lipopolysaccharide export system ATP-binding protein